ncbi:MAG TPA: ABC transporter permease [Gemmatimonadota bacterium]|nr:ABC transporter permease [Gemmatimonadota bacterium]
MAEARQVLTAPVAPTVGVGPSLRRLHWAFVVGASFFATVCVLLILTPWIAPYDQAEQDLLARLQPPSAAHWLGTDHLGRDVLSRLLNGGRFSVSIAAVAVLITGISGTLIGAVSARVGGLLDDLLMRLVDALLAFPEVLIALFLVFVLGPGYGTLIVALAITGWTPFARLTRAVTLEINTRGYIEAAEALGCSRTFIILRHVLPNAIGPVLAQGFLRYGHQLITVGGLSYLGLGVQRPESDWGAMLAEATVYMIRAPWLVILPGLAIFLTALSVTLAGHGLRQSLRRGGPRGLGAVQAPKGPAA